MTEQYLPFFRKYRPQSFKDIVGQENLVKALSNAVETGKIAHAYLFCGPRGTGKTSSARILAKSLNCENAPTVSPCQKCQSCVDITNSNGIDVIEIDAATNRGIDNAKDLIEQTQYAPMNGKYKIFIIDEVHMLTTPAFNALLKTLEEPPENVVFILATTEPHKVLETIISRCQRFDFRRITIDDIVKKLKDVSKLENINITDEALYTIANNVSGGLRDSLSMLDQVSILSVGEEITKKTIEDLIGKLTFSTMFDLVDSIIKSDLQKAFKLIEEIYARGNEPRNLAENIIEFLKNTIIAVNSQNNTLDFINLSTDEVEKIKNSDFKQEKLVKILDKMLNFYKEIKNATNPYLWVELGIIELCNIDNLSVATKPTVQAPVQINKEIKIEKPQIEEIKEEITEKKPEIIEAVEEVKEIEEPKQIEEETKIEEPKQAEEPISNPTLQNTNDLKEVWTKIINSIEGLPAKCFFSGVSRLVEIGDENITIGFYNQNIIEQAKSDSKMTPLKNAIKEVFEKNLNIIYKQISKDTPSVSAKVEAQPQPKKTYTQPVEIEKPQANTEEKAKKEPQKEVSVAERAMYSSQTREMLESFNAKIID